MPFVVANSAGKLKPQREADFYEKSSSDATYIHLSVSDSVLTMRAFRMADGVLIDEVYVKHD